MSDIGFSELILIAIVGLVVIGPEKLPHAIRTCALWIGRMKRSITETRREIEQQLGADEIRRELQNEQVMRNLERLKDTRDELEARIRSLGTDTYAGQDAAPGSALIESTDHVHHHTGSEHDHHSHADHNDHAHGPAHEHSHHAHAHTSEEATDQNLRPAHDSSSPKP